MTFNTKWQLNARFGFPTAIKCLDYEFIFERFHGIKYNKLSERKKQEMRGKKGPVETYSDMTFPYVDNHQGLCFSIHKDKNATCQSKGESQQ